MMILYKSQNALSCFFFQSKYSDKIWLCFDLILILLLVRNSFETTQKKQLSNLMYLIIWQLI